MFAWFIFSMYRVHNYGIPYEHLLKGIVDRCRDVNYLSLSEVMNSDQGKQMHPQRFEF